ncbi:MAG TPA: PTS mannose transporter subunit IIA, partial [Propionibacteriaceae bacterium]|nr:PTS mannose transporter subunit IIA [Propionibacteriaceae bacterium]HBY21835.1 PTS mannose transporter subunit IIA [Propionibacteriaceae bacterium]
GIHEIYFPYVLMKPVMILSTIAGGMTGVLINVMFNGGLRAPAAPGSIIAIYTSVTPQGFIGVTLSWIGAAAVSLVVGAFLLRISKDDSDGDLSQATSDMEALKGKKSSVSGLLAGGAAVGVAAGPVKNIVFACDAGMGSSAMGASLLRKKIQDAGYKDIKVVNQAIANLTDSYDVIVTHQDLANRAAPKVPSAQLFTVDNFMGSPVYDDVVDYVKKANAYPTYEAPAAATVAAVAAPVAAAKADILDKGSIVVAGTATTKEGAIDEVGRLLVKTGAVDEGYIASMHDRERSVSTYMGNLLAIPHGTNEAKDLIKRSAMAIVKYPNGIEWNGKPVKFVIGIAGANNEHLALLSKIAILFSNKDDVAALEQATSADAIADALGKVNG